MSVPACAQPSLRFTPFGDSRGAANPPVARYMAGEGKSFIFDRSPDSSEALLKFDDNPEVWALEPSPGPGGVTIYRNDAGDPVVRVTRLGGVTLYTPREPDGVPAALFGDAGDILLPPFLPTGLLFQRSIPQASDRCSQAAQHLVTVEANNMTPATSPLFLDAITITTDAIVKLARRKEAKTFLTRLEKVMFITGTKPDVSFNKTVMTITIAPSKGYAGRPSSDRITKVAIKH
ncbi:MAG: DUF4908 domain-containing protein [Caulobacteraceae bacterium]